ncbi:pPIWI_RE module domain-containing protein [Nocardia neocaledoniensis]|uniref:pPIWI_RE module domain-containing protein n=1 Tax=Nocardia neocaledoniensis TaxID=236511 RepID=UPI002455DBD2|nr:DUF3962 domain-containing protein [Nocardia neocaledoniensis]
MTYNQLRSTSFHLNLGAVEPFAYYTLPFPKQWREPLLDLFVAGKGNRRYEKVPIRSLNDAVALLAPDLIRAAQDNVYWNGEDWLYATEPVPIAAIARIVRAWINTGAKRIDPTKDDVQRLKRALELVQPGAPGWDVFEWKPGKMDLAAQATEVGANGTSKPDAPLFSLLPHILCKQLSAPGIEWQHGGGPIEFRRSITDAGADLVSWQPSNERLPFSYHLTLQVQTVPGRADPAVYADFGVRRWAYNPVKGVSSTSNTNAYLLRSHPLLDDTGRSRAFRRIGIRWYPGRGTVWNDRLAPILDHLNPRTGLPDPAELVADPRAFLKASTSDDCTVVVFGNGRGRHEVEPGLSVREKRDFFDWTSHILEPWVQPDEPLTRVFGPRAFATSPKIVKNTYARAASIERKKIRDTAKTDGTDPTPLLRALPSKFAPLVQAGLTTFLRNSKRGPHLCLDVHHFEDSPLTDLVTAAISSDLGPATQTSTGAVWNVGDGTVTLRAHRVRGQHADKVAIPVRASRTLIQDLLQKRAAEIEAALPTRAGQAGQLTASIVEVHNREFFKSRPLGDVKPVFRLAHANAGRITQFVNPPYTDDADHDRILRVWRDVLRQLGVLLVPAQIKVRNATVPDPLHYVAIWVVRVNRSSRRAVGRRVPIMVWLDSTGAQPPQMVSPYFEWTDYHDGLTQLAKTGRFDVEARTPQNREVVSTFITDRLRDITALRKDTLLLTDTGNLRPDWPYINNGNLSFDRLGDHSVIGTGLRHVRLRDDCDNLEVPHVWGIGNDEKDEWGLASGLWRMHGTRVFASTADKPVQAQKAMTTLSKVDGHTYTPRATGDETPAEVTRPPAPTAEVWNPRMVEMTVAALQPGDTPETWAGITHQLRWANIQYDDGTTLPMPLHLARLAEEYVLGTHIAEVPTADM